MAALAADRNTPYRDGVSYQFGVATGQTIYAGALVMLTATGYARPAGAATGLVAVGRAEERVVNAGADGAVRVNVRRGVFRWDSGAAGDLITIAEIGDPCYAIDDHTVGKTDGGGTRSVAGTVVDVDAIGVWVETR